MKISRLQLELRRKVTYNTASPEEQTTLFIKELEFEFDVFGRTARITSASPTPKTEPEVKRNSVRNPRESTSKTATEAEFKSAVAEVEKEWRTLTAWDDVHPKVCSRSLLRMRLSFFIYFFSISIYLYNLH